MKNFPLFIVSCLLITSTIADFPYDFQGSWGIGGLWGFENQKDAFCPRAVFDVQWDSPTFLFEYEWVDKNKYITVTNRSYYIYDYENDNNAFRDVFTPLKWKWDVTYNSSDYRIVALSQDNLARGMFLFKSYRRSGDFIEIIKGIVSKLSLKILPKLSFYTQQNCQYDRYPLATNFKPFDINQEFWYGATIGPDAQPCFKFSVNRYSRHRITFNSDSDQYYFLPHPTYPAFLIQDNDDFQAQRAAAVLYSTPTYFIMVYVNSIFGAVFNSKETFTEREVDKIKEVLTKAGYYLVDRENFHVNNNSICEASIPGRFPSNLNLIEQQEINNLERIQQTQQEFLH